MRMTRSTLALPAHLVNLYAQIYSLVCIVTLVWTGSVILGGFALGYEFVIGLLMWFFGMMAIGLIASVIWMIGVAAIGIARFFRREPK